MCREASGQALAVLVALVGLGALVVVALVDADGRLITHLRAQRLAEAAAEAAGVVVSDRLLELRDEALLTHRDADVIAIALDERSLAVRAEASAREVLTGSGAELLRIALVRRADELSVRAEVRLGEVPGVARVGVRAP